MPGLLFCDCSHWPFGDSHKEDSVGLGKFHKNFHSCLDLVALSERLPALKFRNLEDVLEDGRIEDDRGKDGQR